MAIKISSLQKIKRIITSTVSKINLRAKMGAISHRERKGKITQIAFG